MLFNHEGTADMRRAVMPSGGRGDASATRRKLSARCCPHSGGAHGWAWQFISVLRYSSKRSNLRHVQNCFWTSPWRLVVR